MIYGVVWMLMFFVYPNWCRISSNIICCCCALEFFANCVCVCVRHVSFGVCVVFFLEEFNMPSFFAMHEMPHDDTNLTRFYEGRRFVPFARIFTTLELRAAALS